MTLRKRFSSAPSGGDRGARAAALARYDILDTPPESGYDDIVVLARQICGTSAALISLIDRDRQWFKARIGFEPCETPLDQSVCRHALTQREPLIIADLAADPRTRDNPLVTGEPFIRFYAGVPLVTPEGTPIGTLCVLDGAPRPQGLLPDQLAAMHALARQVMSHLELRRLARVEAIALAEEEARRLRYEAIFESAVDYAIIVMDKQGLITEWNEGATRILGWTRDEIVGRDMAAFFTAEDRAAGIPEAEVERARTEGRGIDERWHLRKGNERFWANGEMMPLKSAEGVLQGYIKILRDRTAQRLSEARLRDSEERLQLLFTASGALGWWDWNIPEDRLVANSQFAELYSVDPQRAADGVSIREFTGGIHPDDRDWVNARIQHAIETAGLFCEEYRLLHADGTVTWVMAQGRCYHDAEGRPLRYPGVSIDITERKAAEARRAGLARLGDLLRDETDPLEMAYVAAQVLGESLAVARAGYGLVDAAAEIVTVERDWNAARGNAIAGTHRFREYGSFVDELKEGVPVQIRDVNADPRTRDCADAFRRVDTRAIAAVPLRENGIFVALFFVDHDAPRDWSPDDVQFIRNVAERVRTAIERVRAEERQGMLNQELSHRLKNTLAMVQAIASQTLRSAPDMATAQESLSSRMIALGRAHDMLLRGVRESAEIRELIMAALEMHENASRFLLSGPPIMVGSRAALSLALMIHELATNAAKYGALAGPEGIVTIDWSVDAAASGSETIRLAWTESGGPAVTPPSRKGFGSRLIERGLAGQIGGTATLTYEPQGLVCRLDAPLAALVDEDARFPRPL